MSLSDTVNSFGRDISTGFSPNGVCGFAPTENTYGFIDTSLAHDGSRGIAFLHSGLCVNLYGNVERMSYENISARLVESYESGYADELILSDGKREIRVSDYSLNKPFLKLLVETLCLRCKQSEKPPDLPLTEIPQANSYNAPDVVYAEPDEITPETDESIYAEPDETAPEPIGNMYAEPVETFPEPDGNIYAAPVETSTESVGNMYEEPVETSAEPDENIFTPPNETAYEPTGNIYAEPDEPAPESVGNVYPAPDETSTKPVENMYTKPVETAPEPAGNIYETSDKPAAENPKPAVPEGYIPPEIPEEKIEWISGDPDEELSGEPSDALDGMSTEETLSFLVNSIREINTIPDEDETDDLDDELSEIPPEELRVSPPVIPEYAEKADRAYEEKSAAEPRNTPSEPAGEPISFVSGESTPKTAAKEPPAAVPPVMPFEQAPAAKEPAAPVFTKEPPSDDVYITASAKLREACESGKLSPETIDKEIKGQLIPAAKVFMEVIASSDIPKTLAPRIAELRAASARIKEYFAIGEDVAARVMFFMLYQMLSYSDRIVEDAATKERLNGFFKRCGPSGITLSMLDIWVRQR